MAFDINGAIIQNSNTALSITTNSKIGLDTSSVGFVTQPNKPAFCAADNYNNWYSYANAGWQNIVFNTPVFDTCGNYDPSTGRFTAPITGLYAFQSSTYSYKSSTGQDSYVHPIFRINDSYTTKQASQTTPYRLRLRTWFTGGYTGDTQINDIFYLVAGDYVNVHHYSSTSPLYWYGTQSYFSGFFIG